MLSSQVWNLLYGSSSGGTSHRTISRVAAVFVLAVAVALLVDLGKHFLEVGNGRWHQIPRNILPAFLDSRICLESEMNMMVKGNFYGVFLYEDPPRHPESNAVSLSCTLCLAVKVFHQHSPTAAKLSTFPSNSSEPSEVVSSKSSGDAVEPMAQSS